jgi:hypothetical protein
MIYRVFYKEVKSQKDEFDISYFLEMKRNSFNLTYEFTGLYKYDFRRYSVTLNYALRNEYYIIDNLTKNFEKIYSSFNETRKLAIIAKFVLYIISKDLNIPLYKLMKSVIYEANGDVENLSVNAFIKSTYKVAQKFQILGL